MSGDLARKKNLNSIEISKKNPKTQMHTPANDPSSSSSPSPSPDPFALSSLSHSLDSGLL